MLVEAGGGVAMPHQRAVSPVLSVDVGGMEVGGGNAAGGEGPVGPVTSEVNGGTIRGGEVRDVTAPVVSEANTKVLEEGERLVGRYIGRSSSGCGRILVEKVLASDDSTDRLYDTLIEDGNGEDVGLPQLRELFRASGMKVSCTKRNLDSLVLLGGVLEVEGPTSTRQKVDACEMSTTHASVT
jgi:hypothetical protein